MIKTRFQTDIETVFDAISEERDYQDKKWNSHKHAMASFVVFMRAYHNQVVMRASKESGWEGSLDEIRKVAALGVSCMEQHGCKRGELKPCPRDSVYAQLKIEQCRFSPVVEIGRYIILIGDCISNAERELSGGKLSVHEQIFSCVSNCVSCMMDYGVVRRKVTNSETKKEGMVAAVAFEMKHGDVAFLKTAASAVNRVLVKKGMVTETELLEEMGSEMERAEKIYSRQDGDVPRATSEGLSVDKANYHQIIKCQCGEEVICFCGRCVKCGTRRNEGPGSILGSIKEKWDEFVCSKNKEFIATGEKMFSIMNQQLLHCSVITPQEFDSLNEYICAYKKDVDNK